MNKEIEDRFRNFLKTDKTHRITPERFKVLDAAMQFEGHFAADELFLNMRNKQIPVSRATVYNTLELLVKCNILTKRNFGGSITRYEGSDKENFHAHFVCTECGKIEEFNYPKLSELVNEFSENSGFDVSGYSFNIYGKCKNEKD